MQHQIPAVIVAMAEHARLGSQFFRDAEKLDTQGFASGGSEGCTSIRFEEMP
jgi:hypothetical protein